MPAILERKTVKKRGKDIAMVWKVIHDFTLHRRR
jgi:hypothetical protein